MVPIRRWSARVVATAAGCVGLLVLTSGLVEVANPRLVTAPHEIDDEPTADVYLPSCSGRAVQEPITVSAWCASGDAYYSDLQWTFWRRTGAEAVGTLFRNSCDCANGRLEAYPVHLRLWDAGISHGTVAFQRLSVQYPRSAAASSTPDGGTYRVVLGGFERISQ